MRDNTGIKQKSGSHVSVAQYLSAAQKGKNSFTEQNSVEDLRKKISMNEVQYGNYDDMNV